MTKVLMTNEIEMMNDEKRAFVCARIRHSCFGIHSSLVIRALAFQLLPLIHVTHAQELFANFNINFHAVGAEPFASFLCSA
jgi:hypothetical protein